MKYSLILLVLGLLSVRVFAEKHWAFEKTKDYPPPEVKGEDFSEIDRFVIAKLKDAGMQLSEPVSKEKLIRRVTFDLTGLPPTWNEVQMFLNDESTDALEKVLDRLLASLGYGERWGRHWLDLARYADTTGGSAIGFKKFPFSWTYRDYVIQAFNTDLPYNEFILQQIAADQLKLPENDPALAGLGFLTIGRQFRNRNDRLDDRIDVISRGILGLTVSCARCHDHKFDPISIHDYYSMHATLASSRVPNELPIVGNPIVSEKYQQDLSSLEMKRDDIIREQGEVFRGRLRMQVGLYLKELAKGVPEQDTSTTFLSYRTEDIRPVVLERWRTYLAKLEENDPVFGPWRELSKLDAEGFELACQQKVEKWIKENGDHRKFVEEHKFSLEPPKWNPRVLEALQQRSPNSFVDVAEVYGQVFADVQRRWMKSLMEALEEAASGGKVIPDEDARHKVVNSSIERQLRHHLYNPGTPSDINFENRRDLGMLNRGLRDSVRNTVSAITNRNQSGDAPPRSMVLAEEDRPEDSFVFIRGNPVSRGDKVEPMFLSALRGENSRIFHDGERRLGLAQEIIDPSNPLTRRVIVNWVWQHHFGEGLVRTPDDFGTRGELPTHPKLLDYLATQLLNDGWSLKKLHRRIILSKVYQQSSIENSKYREIDPENRLLWKMPVRMLEMEAMRDSLLAVSGELNRSMGGRPFEEKGSGTVPRRSVYGFVNRDVISNLASTFNAADPEACTVKRPRTLVPQQTLYALNSDYIQNRASSMLRLQEFKSLEKDALIQYLYQRIYSRSANDDEVKSALKFINGSEKPDNAWKQLAHAMMASNEFHFID